nr:hypothetical protein [Magnetospirillum molischianum]
MLDLMSRGMRIAGRGEKTFFVDEMPLKQSQKVIDCSQNGTAIPLIDETRDHYDLIENFLVFTVELGIAY